MSQEQKELYIETLIRSSRPLSEVVKILNEIDQCEVCGGTGEVSDIYFDDDSHECYEDGVKKCICQLNLE